MIHMFHVENYSSFSLMRWIIFFNFVMIGEGGGR